MCCVSMPTRPFIIDGVLPVGKESGVVICMRVKICGVMTVDDAVYSASLGADAIGMIVCSDSPREITLEQAGEIIAAVGSRVRTVCVTHTASPEDLERILALCPAAVQISHDFPLPAVRDVAFIRVIKPPDMPRGDCDAVIVDASRGTGCLYDPVFARRIVEESPVPVILAGGLTPENVEEAIDTVRPYAVDACSGLEAGPGVKDREKIRAFMRACRGGHPG